MLDQNTTYNQSINQTSQPPFIVEDWTGWLVAAAAIIYLVYFWRKETTIPTYKDEIEAKTDFFNRMDKFKMYKPVLKQFMLMDKKTHAEGTFIDIHRQNTRDFNRPIPFIMGKDGTFLIDEYRGFAKEIMTKKPKKEIHVHQEFSLLGKGRHYQKEREEKK